LTPSRTVGAAMALPLPANRVAGDRMAYAATPGFRGTKDWQRERSSGLGGQGGREAGARPASAGKPGPGYGAARSSAADSRRRAFGPCVASPPTATRQCAPILRGMRSVATLVLSVAVAGCVLPPRQFTARFPGDGFLEALPVVLEDRTGLVESISIGPPAPMEIHVGEVAAAADPTMLVAAWLGGACDRKAHLIFERLEDSRYRIAQETSTTDGACILLGVERTVTLRLSEPLDATAVTLESRPDRGPQDQGGASLSISATTWSACGRIRGRRSSQRSSSPAR
jgi:hypothetical protein